MTTNLVADGGYILDAGAAPVVLPPGLPDVMDAGIYFGLDEGEYHAAHALSASGIKWLRISPLDFWARSSMNPDREPEEESQAKVIGKAYHKRIAEGRAAFLASFAPEVDPMVQDDVVNGRLFLAEQAIKATLPDTSAADRRSQIPGSFGQ